MLGLIFALTGLGLIIWVNVRGTKNTLGINSYVDSKVGHYLLGIFLIILGMMFS
jgi:hypothetical protein